MKESYINNLSSSFYLWLDHEILSKGEGFINCTGNLYKTYDPNLSTSSIYGSAFRQWVYDYSIPNAIVCSGFFINNNFYNRDNTFVSGLSIDYTKGRIIFNNQNNVNITGSPKAVFSLKEYNLYYTDEREEKLLFEKSYSVTPKTYQTTGALNYLDAPYPCIFIKHRFGENTPFAFGGLETTNNTIRCIILASNSFSLDSVISILNDANKKMFPLLNSSDLPFDFKGDFKTFEFDGIHFDYIRLCETKSQSDLILIKNVTITKLDEIDNSKINKKCVAALVDFELESVRKPRVY
jgi:hypothetical protein